VVVFGNDLKRVSVECDEVEEKQSDRPKESGGARETCHDGLLGHDRVHHQGHRYLARGAAGGTSFFCDC
jgi:hypothetical protein